MTIALVTGAGGFIGGHLVRALQDEGTTVYAVDRKPLDVWYQLPHRTGSQVFPDCDLELQSNVWELPWYSGISEVYNLAADMGGMGYIENHKADCMRSVLISTNVLDRFNDSGTSTVGKRFRRYFYSSSACVYAADKQTDTDVTALKESDAYPAMPEDGYGWEKLFSERMCRHYTEDYGLTTRVARFHNVYGPNGTWDGERAKAPAAICRKVIQAKESGCHEIEIWGDGEQTRSFMYVDDCVEGILRIMRSGIDYPINLGSSELVSINQLVSIVEEIAGVELHRIYDLDAPKGVRGRNSDNTLIRQELDWEPSTTLRDGLERTYAWIYDEIKAGRSGE